MTMKSTFRRLAFSCLILAGLGGCFVTADGLLRKHSLDAPQHSGLRICRHYGCSDIVAVRIDAEQWQRVTRWLMPLAESAAEERAALAEAIGAIERIVGPKTGTSDDPSGSKFYTPDSTGEMDCLDEAANTTQYLHLIQAAGLLRWHHVGRPAYRGHLIDGAGPHNTATMIETASGERFAVDSFFHGNGNPADILPLSLWKRNWTPQRRLPPRHEDVAAARSAVGG